MDLSEVYSKFLSEVLSEELERLEKDFYEKVLEELRHSRGEEVAVKHVLNTLKYLFLLRLIKELRLLYSNSFKIDLDGLPEIEKSVLENVLAKLRSLGLEQPPPPRQTEKPSEHVETPQAKFSKEAAPALSRAEEKEKMRTGELEAPEEMTLVFFLKPYPRVIDRGVSLGPFNRGDVAFLPKRLARDLVASGYAEEIPRQ